MAGGGAAVECPSCHKEVIPGRVFCPWCKTFLLDIQRGTRASIPLRVWSTVLDGLVPGGAVVLVAILFASVRGETAQAALGFLILAIFLANVVADLVLMARGKTLGKWLTGEVILKKEEGSPAGFWRMVLREVVGKFISSLLLGVGYLWAIFDRDRQAWHDKIAGTVVVKESREGPRLATRPSGPIGTP